MASLHGKRPWLGPFAMQTSHGKYPTRSMWF